MNSQDFRNLQEAYLDVYYELDEAEGSYGQTPKADAAYTALAFGRGVNSKTKAGALKHLIRSASHRYNSDKPSPHRSNMTQSDRDYHRGQSENGGKDREGIDFDEFDTGASGPGGKPKGKKLERQIKRGISAAESYDLYDIILSHLLYEGYADTQEQAEVIMVNMSEDWRESICEGYKRFPYKKVEDKIHKKEDNPTGRGTPQSIQMGKVSRHFRGGKEIPPVEKREHSPQISKAREAENRARDSKVVSDSYDLYDIILSHLLDEGYADTQEQAEVIMVNMSEDWRESICEGMKPLPVGKMLKQAARHSNPEQVTKMGKVADDHNPKKSKRKEDDNRREGGRKRDAGMPRSNELQDNW